MRTAHLSRQLSLIAGVLALSWSSPALAVTINWADEVTTWHGYIQNYGFCGSAAYMDAGTTWWLTGPPDADRNDNGYAWDCVDIDTPIDSDTVAGWKNIAGVDNSADFTVQFDLALEDRDGYDLLVVGYGNDAGQFSVHGSSDNSNFVHLGTANGVTPGYLTNYWFDFAGLVDDVHYIKIVREKLGPKTGMLFDAVGGVVPEPNAIGLLASGVFAAAGCLVARRTRRKSVCRARNRRRR